jgi:hypothetical protein
MESCVDDAPHTGSGGQDSDLTAPERRPCIHTVLGMLRDATLFSNHTTRWTR